MKNVTITVSEQVLADARVKAAKAGKSLSRYVGDLLQADVSASAGVGNGDRKSQIEALERVLNGPKWSLLRDGRMPTADERNER